MFYKTFKNIDDIVHKDAVCGSELGYVEQTSWILFPKYLDDFEKDKVTAAELSGKTYTPIIDKKFQWTSWAAPKGKDGKIDHHKSDRKFFGFDGDISKTLIKYLRKQSCELMSTIFFADLSKILTEWKAIDDCKLIDQPVMDSDKDPQTTLNGFLT